MTSREDAGARAQALPCLGALQTDSHRFVSGSAPGSGRQGRRPAGTPTLQSQDFVRIRLIDQVTGVIKTAIRAGAVVACAYILSQAMEAFAGQSTSVFVQLMFSVIADVKFAVALGAGAGGLLFGLSQYLLRRRTIKRLHPRAKQLEEIIDSNRTSSNLTLAGETNPSDREP